MRSFYSLRSQKRNISVKSSVSFYAFGIRVHKSFSKNVDEIDTKCQCHRHFTCSVYTRRSQKRKKIQLSHQYLFTLLGSAGAKAVRRTLMKLSPGCNEYRLYRTQFEVLVRIVFNPKIGQSSQS